MKVLDLFAGLGGWGKPFRERGHGVGSVDIEERFAPSLIADVLDLPDDMGEYDIILASPPCERFSIMSIARYWRGFTYQNPGPEVRESMDLVLKAVAIIEASKPKFWIIENPVGMLRKLEIIPYERQTVTYCQYGARVRKATDLWGGFPPSWIAKPRCRNYDRCHVAAPRGSRTGTQGPESAAERAKIPYELAMAICLAAEHDLALGLRASDFSGRLFA